MGIEVDFGVHPDRVTLVQGHHGEALSEPREPIQTPGDVVAERIDGGSAVLENRQHPHVKGGLGGFCVYEGCVSGRQWVRVSNSHVTFLTVTVNTVKVKDVIKWGNAFVLRGYGGASYPLRREVRMSQLRILIGIIMVASLALACGSSEDDPGGGADAGTNGGADAGDDGSWELLIGSTWTIPAATETYQCERLTVTEDMWITQFRAGTPLGTHHSVLTVGDGSAPDGPFPCDAGTNDDAMIYGAGIDTNPIALPEGVAMRVRAGQQLLLNLHLYNVSDGPLTGTSTVEMKRVTESEVQHEAEVILMGKVPTLQVPVGESTQIGTCVMNGDVTLFMVNPHMHQLGTWMKVIAERDNAEDVVMHDAAYDFLDQKIYPITPVEMKQGDRVKVHCSYNNTTGSQVGWGDSSDQEMCFATTYRYPARGASFNIICASD